MQISGTTFLIVQSQGTPHAIVHVPRRANNKRIHSRVHLVHRSCCIDDRRCTKFRPRKSECLNVSDVRQQRDYYLFAQQTERPTNRRYCRYDIAPHIDTIMASLSNGFATYSWLFVDKQHIPILSALLFARSSISPIINHEENSNRIIST